MKLVSLHGIVVHLEDLWLWVFLLLSFDLIRCLKGLSHTYPIQKYVPFLLRVFYSNHSVPSGLHSPFPQVQFGFPGNINIEALTWTITLTFTFSLSSFQIDLPLEGPSSEWLSVDNSVHLPYKPLLLL